MRIIAALNVAALLVLAHALNAQSPSPAAPTSQPADSLPFRKGQWGAQFTGGPELTSLGALRFTSPRAAWLLQLDANLAHEKQRIESGPDGPFPAAEERRYTTGAAGLRVGRRSYRALGRRVAGFSTAGLTARYMRSEQNGGPVAVYGTSIGGGLFGDLGATYLVSEHFGIGASTGLEARYDWHEASGGITKMRGSNISIRLTPPVALLSVYF
jgi:hypothetical protein